MLRSCYLHIITKESSETGAFGEDGVVRRNRHGFGRVLIAPVLPTSYSATTRLGFMPTFTHLLYLHFLHLYIWVKESHVSILLIHVYLVGSRPPLCLLCACRKKLRHQRQATAPYSYHPNPCLPWAARSNVLLHTWGSCLIQCWCWPETDIYGLKKMFTTCLHSFNQSWEWFCHNSSEFLPRHASRAVDSDRWWINMCCNNLYFSKNPCLQYSHV